MERYVDGDSTAFDELFRRYEPRAFSYFLRRTGSPDRAQDLYQDLFLRIHRARDTYDSRRSFAPWLQSVGTSWSVFSGWLLGTAVGAYGGVAIGVRMRTRFVSG